MLSKPSAGHEPWGCAHEPMGCARLQRQEARSERDSATSPDAFRSEWPFNNANYYHHRSNSQPFPPADTPAAATLSRPHSPDSLQECRCPPSLPPCLVPGLPPLICLEPPNQMPIPEVGGSQAVPHTSPRTTARHPPPLCITTQLGFEGWELGITLQVGFRVEVHHT